MSAMPARRSKGTTTMSAAADTIITITITTTTTTMGTTTTTTARPLPRKRERVRVGVAAFMPVTAPPRPSPAGGGRVARLFDTYIIVDWSAARTPKTGRDSIWICRRSPAGETVANPPTRHAARLLLAEMLGEATANGERVVAGFDFPFGYPAGFASRLGLGGTPWRAVWDEIARLIEDRDDNDNNRFAVAALLNERVSGGAFPFWGRPVRMESAFLGAKHHK